jgi:hypothetical protein
MNETNQRWAIRRRVKGYPDLWINSISGQWCMDWGSRRLFSYEEDAEKQAEALRESGQVGVKVIPVTRKPA